MLYLLQIRNWMIKRIFHKITESALFKKTQINIMVAAIHCKCYKVSISDSYIG